MIGRWEMIWERCTDVDKVIQKDLMISYKYIEVNNQ